MEKIMNKYDKINNCRCCGKEIVEYLNLGDQPLANNYHDNTSVLDVYPLSLCVCPICFHNQLSIVVNPDEMFKTYSYVSGTSKTLDEYFSWFADFVLKNKNKNNINVLDIACNDGSQLKHFLKRKCQVWGVDPAENITPYAITNGINVKVSYWNDKVANELLDEIKKPFDIIIAQNVFAHTNDILKFLNSCKIVMDENTDLYIQTSQANMIEENQFDTAYHEHLSFFNTNSIKIIVEKAGLHLNDVHIVPIHGNSYVFKINLIKNESISVAEQLKKETNKNLYSMIKYEEFRKNAINIVDNLRNGLQQLKNEGYKIIGYGAAAKGMTVLNFANIKYPLVEYIIDDNPLKHGKFTPGSNIPITSVKILENEKEKIVIIPLAWNFFDEIKNKIKNHCIATDIVYVKYFPKYELQY